jgi:hypothetical protein
MPHRNYSCARHARSAQRRRDYHDGQVLLLVLAFRQRRARLRELDYDSPAATAAQRAADSAIQSLD